MRFLKFFFIVICCTVTMSSSAISSEFKLNQKFVDEQFKNAESISLNLFLASFWNIPSKPDLTRNEHWVIKNRIYYSIFGLFNCYNYYDTKFDLTCIMP